MRPPTLIQHLELEPRAADFLELLRELEHVDERVLARITDRLVIAPRKETRIGFDELRRAVAIELFEKPMHQDARATLDAEWARLFS